MNWGTHTYTRKSDGVLFPLFKSSNWGDSTHTHTDTHIRLECSLSYLNFIVWRWLLLHTHTRTPSSSSSFWRFHSPHWRPPVKSFVHSILSPFPVHRTLYACLRILMNIHIHLITALWWVWFDVFQVPRDYLFIYKHVCECVRLWAEHLWWA